MANKMLIDATHPEETRVVVVRGSRVEEFDFEAASKKQLRGNIYLAKVTRVEPSLQAAFVDYGGNRHGFLAFSEIHPDYYQIPFADRQALLEEEARYQQSEEGRSSEDGRGRGEGRGGDEGRGRSSDDARPPADEGRSEGRRRSRSRGASSHGGDHVSDDGEAQGGVEEVGGDDGEDQVESVGAEDALEEVPERRQTFKLKRHYKIQEVIKRRQVLLVQVVKEERGNKGAALTTYLSLAGRYSVLMPNTARGGGISRKITNPADRKRLKKIAQELEVPEGMGVIVRTAGAARTKTEIKRDFEYLLRLWENVRELTLQSSAPKLTYEEGSLIKRSIRDLYNKDIDEILVAGEDGYREAKDFMRMLMPSHAKSVQPYREPTPVFTRFAVESQLDAMFSPQVTLRSGGYLVINQTEALVSIDVNSGKSTREHNIEDTAVQTNLEAAEEVARQLRLRDLAGLVVIDFIDMEENRNNRAVERKLKDCLKNDRARIQVGRISHFGLMEMSRQRIRTGVLESSMVVCPHCAGTGMVRSTESVALHVLRSLEEMLIKSVTHDLIVRTRTTVCLYILNQKRAHLADLEHRFGLMISVFADDHASTGGHLFMVEKGEITTRVPHQPPLPAHFPIDPADLEDDYVEIEEVIEEEDEDEIEVEADESAEAEAPAPRRREAQAEPREPREQREARSPEAARSAEGGEAGSRRRRRRRRRGRGRNGEGTAENGGMAPLPGEQDSYDRGGPGDEDGVEGDETDAEFEAAEATTRADGTPLTAEESEELRRKKRRRGRRGGRRNKRERGEGETGADAGAGGEGTTEAEDTDADSEAAEAPVAEARPAGGRRRRRSSADQVVETALAEALGVDLAETGAPASDDVLVLDRDSLQAEAAEAKAPAKPKRLTKAAKAALAAAEAEGGEAAAEAPAPTARKAPKAAKPAAAPKRGRKAAAAATDEASVTEAPVEAEAVEAGPATADEPMPEAPVPAPVAVEPAEPAPQLTSTELDPNRPKKSGWWAKR